MAASVDNNEIEKIQEERKKMEKDLASLTDVVFDKEFYGGNDRYEGYEPSIPVDEDDDTLDAKESEIVKKMSSFTAPKSVFKDRPRGGDDDEALGFPKSQKIIDREDLYRRRRLDRVISPERDDAFANGDKTPDVSVRT